MGAGAVVGVVTAGVAVGVGELAAAFVRPSAAPVIAVGNRVVALTPRAVKEWDIRTFGTSDKTVLLTGVLVARKVKGALLIGIIASTFIAMIVEAFVHLGSKQDNPGGWSLQIPTLPSQVVSVPDFSLVGQVSFGSFERIGILAALMLVFTLVFTNFFDAMGTMTGLSKEAGLSDEKGNFPRLKWL